VLNVLEHEDRQTSNLARYARPLLPLLADPTTLDIVINADGSLWVNRLGGGFECEGSFPAHSSKLLLNGIATVRQIQFDHERPILETIFPLTGDRIEGLIWPVVTNAIFAIRTRQKKLYPLSEMAKAGILTDKNDPLNARRHHDDFLARISHEYPLM
jgi:type IV secretion system protein VirB11